MTLVLLGECVRLFPLFLLGFMCPLLSHSHLSNPDFLLFIKITQALSNGCLTLFHSLLSTLEAHSLNSNRSPAQFGPSPVYIQVEDKQKWISQDELIFAQISEEKLHLYGFCLDVEFSTNSNVQFCLVYFWSY